MVSYQPLKITLQDGTPLLDAPAQHRCLWLTGQFLTTGRAMALRPGIMRRSSYICTARALVMIPTGRGRMKCCPCTAPPPSAAEYQQEATTAMEQRRSRPDRPADRNREILRRAFSHGQGTALDAGGRTDY